jgi:MFS family permease
MSLCLGMLILALPLYLAEVGMGYVPLSAVLAATGIGSAASGVPTGDLIARLGPRRTLLLGNLVVALTTAPLAFTEDPVTLFALQLAAGFGAMALRLGGQTWITRTVEADRRGRVLSGMGGLRRVGAFIGPFIAGLAIEWAGYAATFAIAAALAAVAVLPALTAGSVEPAPPAERPPLFEVFRRHGRLLMVVAAGPILIMMARRGRSVVVPLIGDDLGLSPTAVGVLVSIGTGLDLVLFPVAGYLMDTFGRLTAIVPAFSLMGIGLILLAVADSTATVAVASGIVGLGNGLSAGTMLTLGSDLAPADSTSQFLAGFASLQDWGSILGPLVVGMVAAGVGLGPSAAVLGVVLFIGVGLIVRNIGETRSTAPAS